MSDVKDKRTFKSALGVSAAIQVSFYLVGGLVCVGLWGWNVDDPITLQIPREGWVGLLISGMVAFAVLLDYIVAAKIVNDWIKRAFLPRLNNGVAKHLLVTSSSSIFALGMVLAIPHFSTLIGVVTGFAVIGMNTWAISLAWIRGGKIAPTKDWIMLASIFFIPYTLWVIAASIYNIATANYSGDVFCLGNQ